MHWLSNNYLLQQQTLYKKKKRKWVTTSFIVLLLALNPICSCAWSNSFNLGLHCALSYVSRSYYKRKENQLVKCVLNTMLVISLICL